MKTAGWLGVVFGLLFCFGRYLELEPIRDLADALNVLRAGAPMVLLGALCLVLDRRLSTSASNAR